MSEAGSSYGNGRSTDCTTEKIVVAAPTPRVIVSTATAVNAGARLSARSPYCVSRVTSSITRVPHASRHSSLYRDTPPKSRSVDVRASSGVMPRQERPNARAELSREDVQPVHTPSGRLQHAFDGEREPLPTRALLCQLLPAE